MLTTERGEYRFRCPRCDLAVVHEATSAICALLVSVGVEEEVWRLPAELREVHRGPSFTPDDLLDFHLLLAGEEWPEHLAAVVEDAST